MAHKKKVKGRTEKYIPSWMKARSDVSKAAWEKRWDRGTAPIGIKGQQYIERTYGPKVQHEEPIREDEEEYDDFDFWDTEY